VAYSNRNVKLCGVSPGVVCGELGATHHSIEDIAWLRAIDNITIVVPADPIETAAAMRWAAETEGPVFIRVSRMSVPELYQDYTFVPGKAVTLREGDDVTLISNGTVLWRALVAVEQLAKASLPGDLHADCETAGYGRCVERRPRNAWHRHRRGSHCCRRPGRCSRGNRGPEPSDQDQDLGRSIVCTYWLGRLPAGPLWHVPSRHRAGGPRLDHIAP
jgi:hypothetical protein